MVSPSGIELGGKRSSSGLVMLDTAFGDRVSAGQSATGLLVVGGAAECGARGPELGLAGGYLRLCGVGGSTTNECIGCGA